jgi:hypothetical protein
MELVFSGQIFEKSPNTKFRGYPSSGTRVFPDMTNRVAAFRSFVSAPKNCELHWTVRWVRLSTITSDYKHRQFRPQYPAGVGLEYKGFHTTLSEVRWFEYQGADFNVSFFTSSLRLSCFLFLNVPRSRVSVLRLVKTFILIYTGAECSSLCNTATCN